MTTTVKREDMFGTPIKVGSFVAYPTVGECKGLSVGVVTSFTPLMFRVSGCDLASSSSIIDIGIILSDEEKQELTDKYSKLFDKESEKIKPKKEKMEYVLSLVGNSFQKKKEVHLRVEVSKGVFHPKALSFSSPYPKGLSFPCTIHLLKERGNEHLTLTPHVWRNKEVSAKWVKKVCGYVPTESCLVDTFKDLETATKELERLGVDTTLAKY